MTDEQHLKSDSERKADTLHIKAAVIDFASSDLFQRTFDDGMALVEETAAYLDGPGRDESKDLERQGALAYAGESMRLTTRLMQVASWLLVQRAVRESEMTAEEAVDEKYRLSAQDVARAKPLEGVDQIPARLKDLLDRSAKLYDRVERLDVQLYREGSLPAHAAGVQAQHDRIAAAFGE